MYSAMLPSPLPLTLFIKGSYLCKNVCGVILSFTYSVVFINKLLESDILSGDVIV